MCEFCQSLIECPVGEKRSVVLAEFDNNHTYRKMRTSMVKDRTSEEEAKVFMHTEYADAEMWQNLSVNNIQYCPICGTNLQSKGDHLIDKDIMDALCYLRSLALIPAASEEAVLGSFKQVHDYIKALEQKLQVELSDECVSKEMQFGRFVVRPGQLEGYLGRTTVVVEKGGEE